MTKAELVEATALITKAEQVRLAVLKKSGHTYGKPDPTLAAVYSGEALTYRWGEAVDWADDPVTSGTVRVTHLEPLPIQVDGSRLVFQGCVDQSSQRWQSGREGTITRRVFVLARSGGTLKVDQEWFWNDTAFCGRSPNAANLPQVQDQVGKLVALLDARQTKNGEPVTAPVPKGFEDLVKGEAGLMVARMLNSGTAEPARTTVSHVRMHGFGDEGTSFTVTACLETDDDDPRLLTAPMVPGVDGILRFTDLAWTSVDACW